MLRNMEKDFGVSLSVECYEPILFYYAVLKGATNVAEDIYVEMLNHGIVPSDACVDSLVLSAMRSGDLAEAADRVQDLYNQVSNSFLLIDKNVMANSLRLVLVMCVFVSQHGARPTATTVLRLLDAALAQGVEHEARTVAALIAHLYSPDERRCAVGYYHEDSNAPAMPASSPALALEEALGPQDERHANVTSASLWRFAEGQPNGFLPAGRLLKYVVPLGHKVRGVLTNEALLERFRAQGLNMGINDE